LKGKQKKIDTTIVLQLALGTQKDGYWYRDVDKLRERVSLMPIDHKR
jgi:hypothetical protein